jgi:hypothetical protein
MKKGFLLEHRLAVRWISGEPETSALGDIKAGNREQRQVESCRCVKCGYVELYARTEA